MAVTFVFNVVVSTEIKEVPFAVYARMHTVCVYGWPAMLLRLIEYQDWRKIGMADMLLLLLQCLLPCVHYSQDCAVRYVRICANMHRHS